MAAGRLGAPVTSGAAATVEVRTCLWRLLVHRPAAVKSAQRVQPERWGRKWQSWQPLGRVQASLLRKYKLCSAHDMCGTATGGTWSSPARHKLKGRMARPKVLRHSQPAAINVPQLVCHMEVALRTT